MPSTTSQLSPEQADTRYQRIVRDVQVLYDDSLTEPEANEAARNLIAFCRILLEHDGESTSC
jgi:hypothetical protein